MMVAEMLIKSMCYI